jgi:hypothetical protein
MKQQDITEKTMTAERVTMKTSLNNIIAILSELQSSPVAILSEFREFYDDGLPLANLYALGYIDTLNDKATSAIHHTFDMLLREGSLEDVGYTSLTEIVALYQEDEDDEPYVE